MALCTIQLGAGTSLCKMTTATVIVPEGLKGPFPVYYLLHGLSDDHSGWTRQTRIESYVSGKPLIVVMPSGERGWYSDSVEMIPSQFESYVVKDIIPFIDATFHTIPTREGRAVGGLSMGGYGAVKFSMKHPDLFRAAVSHSGAVTYATRNLEAETEMDKERRLILGPEPIGCRDDLFAIAENADHATLPALQIDCGVDDFLIEDNRLFDKHLTKLGIPHSYTEFPGNHDWGYWDLHVQEALQFVYAQFGIV